MAGRMRNWCFTKYELTLPEFDPLVVRYCVWQHEICPDTNREHIQGYIELLKSTRLGAVKRLFNDQTMHLERRNGTRDQARNYCMKEESRKEGTLPEEFGEWEVMPGKRNDLDDIYAKLLTGTSLREIRHEYFSQYVRYHRAFEKIARELDQEKHALTLTSRVDQLTLLEWQQECVDLLKIQNDRQVLWVVDELGNKGKSVLARYLKFKFGAMLIKGGRSEDIGHEYNFEEYVAIDMTRKTEFMPYGIIEQFKDGCIASPKYESGHKFRADIKVIVFSNEHPIEGRFSVDRYIIKEI